MRFGAVMALAWLPLAVAQTTTPPTPPPPAFTARSTVVLVPALVRNKAKELVFTLTANDFMLTDDGVEQKVTLEQDTDSEPLALVIAIQTGGAGREHLDEYAHLATMIEAVVGNVPRKIAVVEFDGAPGLIHNFTPDLDVVGETIR
ncbi:MAG: VWA domain-containing protein, partial [Terriglobales bacterium]